MLLQFILHHVSERGNWIINNNLLMCASILTVSYECWFVHLSSGVDVFAPNSLQGAFYRNKNDKLVGLSVLCTACKGINAVRTPSYVNHITLYHFRWNHLVPTKSKILWPPLELTTAQSNHCSKLGNRAVRFNSRQLLL